MEKVEGPIGKLQNSKQIHELTMSSKDSLAIIGVSLTSRKVGFDRRPLSLPTHSVNWIRLLLIKHDTTVQIYGMPKRLAFITFRRGRL